MRQTAMMTARWRARIALAMLALAGALGPAPVWGQAGETAAMIAEIKGGRGKVEIKGAGGEWRRAAPLNALRAGDQVRADGDATAVVLLTGGRGTVRVEAKSSPYTVGAASGDDGKLRKARTLLSASFGFLSAGPSEAPTATLGSRATVRAPEILTPRDGPVLPDSLVFEWLGSQFSRYTVRVLDPAGVVLERKGVVGARFAYPRNAPALAPAIRYRFQVEALGHPPYEAWFEIVGPARAEAVRDDLAQIEVALGAGTSANSLAAVKAGALAAQGFFHDARGVALGALDRDPDEPALHLLLGNLYLKSGLSQLAAESFAEARFLMSGEGRETGAAPR